MSRWSSDSVQVGLNLGVVSLQGTWKPSQVERLAAWELYIELITRIAVVPLQPGEGLLREALTSLHSLFGSTREVLRRHGPDVARSRDDSAHSFGELAILVLNYELRPVLARWHPLLEQWEGDRPAGMSRTAHEDAWPHAGQLREQLEVTRRHLVDYADLLAAAAQVPPLTAPATG